MEQNRTLKLIYIGLNTTITQRLEEDQRFDLHKEENTLKALEWLLQNSDCDAIVTSYRLPGMDGIEFCSYVRRNVDNTLPYVILHLEQDQNLTQRAMQAGADDLYPIGIDLDTLYARVSFLLRLKKEEDYTREVSKGMSMFKLSLEKRIFDIILASFALLALSPLLIFVAIAIRLESKGKVYYTSKRVGTGYKIFDFYKFRSMDNSADKQLEALKNQNQYADADETPDVCPDCTEEKACSPILFIDDQKICEAQFIRNKRKERGHTFIKIENDPRITKVGKIIRNTSIDELPQLFNVLKGDMSIVGNRPLPLYEAELLTTDEWTDRFRAPAGITGLWQVMKRGKGGPMSPEERKGLDNHYADNHSFWFDLKIILMTVPALFQQEDV